MAREIKFRGFNRKNQTWLYGFYLQKRWSSESSCESYSDTAESRQSSAEANRGAHFVCPDEFSDGKSWDDYEIDPNTLGQFTGLKDKNGKEIYEGDIIRVPRKEFFHAEITGIVFYSGGGFLLASLLGGLEDIESAFKANLPYCIEDGGEVLGNIHDNPELLTPKQ